ncbi:response regulator [Deinococcus yavapaiensis]|uniref:Two-component system response regulator n=1 Tax=Deinococcus yavapaiensis KR-236 TaxID=694435 RepID=A0A318SID2_9DEIO|nr:response regulator [Deinococcus yavapaiensis]PYE53817.1 two-component system response regulator [Deinococcus yavapaiensis KR-236]
MSTRSLPVLLAEDNEGYSYLTRRLLERINPAFDVQVARDGQEALSAVREHPPRLMLLDLVMPSLSGLELLRHLKSDPSTSAMPIIVLTGHDDDHNVRGAYQQYANAVLIKPDTPERLQAALSALNAFWFHHVLFAPDRPPSSELS